jgi:hypothetical protein
MKHYVTDKRSNEQLKKIIKPTPGQAKENKGRPQEKPPAYLPVRGQPS